MKKILLSLVAAMIAVISFAQPVAMKPARQMLSLAGAKLATVENSLSLRPIVKNVQTPSTKIVKVPRRAEGEFSVTDLAGDYISAMYTYGYDTENQKLVPNEPRCETGIVSIEPGEGNEITIYGLLSIYGIEDYGIKATVNLEDFTLVIPNKQIIATDETYGDITMQNVSTEGDFTGTIYTNGILIDQLWMGSVSYQGSDVRLTDYFQTMLMFPNGVMSYKDAKGNDVEAYVTVEQNEETKALTVYNFGDLGSVLDVTIMSDKSFIIDGNQIVASSSSAGAYKPYGLTDDGESLLDLTGKCTETSLTSDCDWTYYSNKGYWYGQMGRFKIEVQEELEFPAVETGELVTAPEGLKTEEYPMSATYYNENQIPSPYSATVKIGWIDKTVYIQGIDKDYPQAWVKGTLNEKNKVEIEPTFMGTKDGVSHFLGSYNSTGIDSLSLSYDIEAKTFEAAGTVMIYKGMKTTAFVGFYNGFFLGVKPSPVALPAGVETVDMPFSGNYMDEYSEDPEQKTGTVKVGRDGEDIYINGLFDDRIAEGGWIKGTFANDTVVVFAMNQYTGILTNALSAYLVGYNPETKDAGNVVMIYNKENNFYTSINPVILTRFKSTIRYSAFYSAGLTIGVNPSSISNLSVVKADKNAWFTINGIRVAQPTQKGIYIRNGKKFIKK